MKSTAPGGGRGPRFVPSLAPTPEDPEVQAIFEQCDKMVEDMEKNVEFLRSDLAGIQEQTKAGICDAEDVKLTETFLQAREAQLQALNARVEKIRTLYRERVVAYELQLEKRKSFLQSMPSLASEPALRKRFVEKDAALMLGLMEIKKGVHKLMKASLVAWGTSVDAVPSSSSSST